MPTNVYMPALGMAQETGVLIQWLKLPGQSVTQGEPLMEIETDKATVEIEAPASGTLAQVTAEPGAVVPVGQVIAQILAPGEPAPTQAPNSTANTVSYGSQPSAPPRPPVSASPVAARMAAEHHLDLGLVKPQGGRVEKQDVLNYLAAQRPAALAGSAQQLEQRRAQSGAAAAASAGPEGVARRVLASPKARRLAQEQGLDLAALPGSGPNGAVLAHDVTAAQAPSGERPSALASSQSPLVPLPGTPLTMSRLWRRMAERLTQAWATIPHFSLQRDVNASRLVAWRVEAQARATEKLTYTDLLVKLLAVALARHPRVNATWQGSELVSSPAANLGLAVAVEDGLVVPVIHNAAALGLGEIAARRAALVTKAQAGKLTPADLEGGTFTLSNLGMYGVDVFNAIVNPPQVAILAVGAVTDRVVPVDGQPAVQPRLTLSLSCDHRAVDGARAAAFLDDLARLIAAPLSVLD